MSRSGGPAAAPPGSVGSARQAHVHPDRGSASAGTQLNQVADLMDDPQAETAAAGGPPVADQRVTDLARVSDLADDLPPGAPQVQRAASRGMPQGVSRHLADSDDQV